jgi:hypothetical protein
MADNMKPIISTVARKEGIAQASPQRYVALRKASEVLSRRNTDQAVCELFGEALMRLVDLCYEEDAGGYCNIDQATNRILIPLPWGKSGHSQWGIRTQEANILRRILALRQRQPGLFLYDRTRRAWRVNLYDFPSRDVAMSYLTRSPVSIAEYRTCRLQVLGEA